MLLLRLFALTLPVPVLVGQTPSESKVHLDRALSLEQQGRIDEAGAEYKAAVQKARNSVSADLLHALDLACTYYQDTGRVAQAEFCLRCLLAIYREYIGAEDLRLNRIVNRLACLYIEIGQRGKAERLDVAKWLARLETEAPLSNDRVDLTGTLAALETIRGNAAAAAVLNARAWEILEKRGHSESNSGITVLNNLSISYSDLRVPSSRASVSLSFRDLHGPVMRLFALKGLPAVLELLATSERAIIIAAGPGRRARSRGRPGGPAQENFDIREVFGLVRFYTDDHLPVVFFTQRDDLLAFGPRLHANYRRPCRNCIAVHVGRVSARGWMIPSKRYG